MGDIDIGLVSHVLSLQLLTLGRQHDGMDDNDHARYLGEGHIYTGLEKDAISYCPQVPQQLQQSRD